MTIETQTIEGLKALYDAATAGPWMADGEALFIDAREQVCCGRNFDECCGDPTIIGGAEQIGQSSPENIALITAMHAELPSLLERSAYADRLVEAGKTDSALICEMQDKLLTAASEAERLRAENGEMRIALEGLLGDYKGSWFATHGGETDFEKLPRVARARLALASFALPAPAQAEPVAPRAEHDPLVEQAEALLDLDAKKALVPYGVCGLARTIIERFIARARGASKPPDGFPIMAGDGSVFFAEGAAPPPPAGEG